MNQSKQDSSLIGLLRRTQAAQRDKNLTVDQVRLLEELGDTLNSICWVHSVLERMACERGADPAAHAFALDNLDPSAVRHIRPDPAAGWTVKPN